MNYGTKTSEIDWTAVVARAAQYARRIEIVDFATGETVEECSLGEFVESAKKALSSADIEDLCTMNVGAERLFGGDDEPAFAAVAL